MIASTGGSNCRWSLSRYSAQSGKARVRSHSTVQRSPYSSIIRRADSTSSFEPAPIKARAAGPSENWNRRRSLCYEVQWWRCGCLVLTRARAQYEYECHCAGADILHRASSLLARLFLLLGPADLRHVKSERIANDRCVGIGRDDLCLEYRLPMGRCTIHDSVQIALLFRPAHLVAAGRELKDRIDLERDGLLLCKLEGVMSEAVGVVISVEEPVRRATRVREQRIEHLMFDLRVAGDRSRIVDKRRDFVALHSRGYIGNGRGSEWLRNRQCVSEFVNFDNVGNVAALADEPDHAAGENERENKQPAGCDLPVAFAENEIGVTLIPFATRFDIRICGHTDAPRRPANRKSVCSPKFVRESSVNWPQMEPNLPKVKEQNAPKTLGIFGLIWLD